MANLWNKLYWTIRQLFAVMMELVWYFRSSVCTRFSFGFEQIGRCQAGMKYPTNLDMKCSQPNPALFLILVWGAGVDLWSLLYGELCQCSWHKDGEHNHLLDSCTPVQVEVDRLHNTLYFSDNSAHSADKRVQSKIMYVHSSTVE